MKSYQKWDKKNCADNCDLRGANACDDCRGLGTREDVWRAAIQHISDRIGKRALYANTLPYLRKHIERICLEELGDETGDEQ